VSAGKIVAHFGLLEYRLSQLDHGWHTTGAKSFTCDHKRSLNFCFDSVSIPIEKGV
jgi:hypothetical protein